MTVNEDLLYRRIGQAIRQEREQRKLTQAELASRIGLQRSSIVNAEAGRQRLPLHIIYGLCEELRLSLADFLPSLAAVTGQGEGVTIGGEEHQVPRKTASFLRSMMNEDEIALHGPKETP